MVVADVLVSIWRQGIDNYHVALIRSMGFSLGFSTDYKLCAGNSPVTAKFPAKMASNAENASIWWRRHGQGVGNPACSMLWRARNITTEHLNGALVAVVITGREDGWQIDVSLTFLQSRV